MIGTIFKFRLKFGEIKNLLYFFFRSVRIFKCMYMRNSEDYEL